MRRTTHRFVGYPLTPVHVGDGTAMTPVGYRLNQSGALLERFDPPAVIAAMPLRLKEQYIDALSKGDLGKAHEYLCDAAGAAAITARLPVSRNSREEIEYALKHPLRRRGSIGRFIHSGETPILPGSSVKGALRTALLAARSVPRDQLSDFVQRIKNAAPGKTGRISEQIQLAAFNVEQHHTEQDPLRDVLVSDAPLAPDSTVIDRVRVANCTKDGPIAIGAEGQMQIHVERLASIADRGEFTARNFKIELAAPDAGAIKERQRLAEARVARDSRLPRAIPRHPLRLEDLLKATNAHHAALWFYERERFYRGTKTYRLLDELLAGFELPVQQDKFEPALNEKGAWLIKLGRYGHFESKSISVDGRRYGQKAARMGRPAAFMSEGGSRTVAVDTDGRLLPFGWVLLFPEDRAPKAVPQLAGPSGSASRATAASGLLFRKGDRVTNDEDATVERDVLATAARMDVRFDDGAIEEVAVKGWKARR